MDEVEKEITNDMYVYPNPVKSGASSTFHLPESKIIKLDLLNSQGMVLSTIAGGANAAGKHSYNLPVKDLPQRIYLTVLKIDDMFITKKVIVNK